MLNCLEYSKDAGFEVVTAMLLKIKVFWGMTPATLYAVTDVSEKLAACVLKQRHNVSGYAA